MGANICKFLTAHFTEHLLQSRTTRLYQPTADDSKIKKNDPQFVNREKIIYSVRCNTFTTLLDELTSCYFPCTWSPLKKLIFLLPLHQTHHCGWDLPNGESITQHYEYYGISKTNLYGKPSYTAFYKRKKFKTVSKTSLKIHL